MRYLVIIRPTRTGYCADAPDLPGCIAAGRTIKGVRKLMAEAIGLHLEEMRRCGEKIPKPRKRVQLNADEFEDDEICTWIEVKALQAA
ncbi:MAG: type II toxin-antitoxin system HicB family antitoxin [Planctomycetes bacterium]|nr:type II toxin-antitoxin system HicB family antitoxin [Planctomycetota bacterium]